MWNGVLCGHRATAVGECQLACRAAVEVHLETRREMESQVGREIQMETRREMESQVGREIQM